MEPRKCGSLDVFLDVVGIRLRFERGAQSGLVATRLAELDGKLDQGIELPNLSGDFGWSSVGSRVLQGTGCELGLIEPAAGLADRVDQESCCEKVREERA